MFLKRLAAILLALVLLVQLAACKDESPLVSSGSTIQTPSREEIDNDSTSQSDDEAENSSSEESNDTISSDATSLEQNQTASTSKPTESSQETNSSTSNDNKQEDNNDKQEIVNTYLPATCKHTSDPYQNVDKTQFYANYKVSCCNTDAAYRSKHGLLSGSLTVPGQNATEAANRPISSGKYIRNTAAVYLDNGNTYIVMDASGKEVMRIHKTGGYITLEEVAAYMFAFGGSGQIPANYTSKKSGKPNSSIWGEYLRLNHSYFIGDTDKYPYEPELPNISGCGGSLQYYEMDIGTTGTTTPGYTAKAYVSGNTITRGAARLVYARQDLNGNGIYENDEIYVFYTHNHYNDFREYLNYYGGWGKMFGNVTGGGVFDSKTNAKPTPYVLTAYKDFSKQ